MCLNRIINRFGHYIKKKRIKKEDRKVAAIIKNVNHHVPDSQLPAMCGYCTRVEVVTPTPLFPYYHNQKTLYRIKLWKHELADNQSFNL